MIKFQYLHHFRQVQPSRKGTNRTDHIPFRYQVQGTTFPGFYRQPISFEVIRCIPLFLRFPFIKISVFPMTPPRSPHPLQPYQTILAIRLHPPPTESPCISHIGVNSHHLLSFLLMMDVSKLAIFSKVSLMLRNNLVWAIHLVLRCWRRRSLSAKKHLQVLRTKSARDTLEKRAIFCSYSPRFPLERNSYFQYPGSDLLDIYLLCSY